jgi:protein gp37
MSEKTGISWTESTWNPTTGCNKISQGCKNCYAEIMANRLKMMGSKKYANGFDISLHPGSLNEPLRWKKPRMIFVNSMSDIFHKDIPYNFIVDIFDVMRAAHWHTFQILTKRSDRLVELNRSLRWTNNIWMGVSIENQENKFRIEDLRKTGAAIRFLSIEPLLEDIGNINLTGIDWVIVGGESGTRARPFDINWARSIRDQCKKSNVAFYMKQLGSSCVPNFIASGKADNPDEWPEDIRIQECPKPGAAKR